MIMFKDIKAQAQAIEFIDLCLGNLIDNGSTRYVYECRLNKDYVIKVENSTELVVKQNIVEWGFWNININNTDVTRWLAPLVDISPCGTFLIQRRCKALPDDYILPEYVPKFLTDVKRDNFGLFDGTLVCMDYGLQKPVIDTKLTRVHWYE